VTVWIWRELEPAHGDTGQGRHAEGGVGAVEMWTKVIVLSIGGTLGVNARYWLGIWINRWASPQFPWATVIINVTGSFLIGFLTIVLTRWMPHPTPPNTRVPVGRKMINQSLRRLNQLAG
jgi:hypothetical protein